MIEFINRYALFLQPLVTVCTAIVAAVVGVWIARMNLRATRLKSYLEAYKAANDAGIANPIHKIWAEAVMDTLYKDSMYQPIHQTIFILVICMLLSIAHGIFMTAVFHIPMRTKDMTPTDWVNVERSMVFMIPVVCIAFAAVVRYRSMRRLAIAFTDKCKVVIAEKKAAEAATKARPKPRMRVDL